MENASKEVVEPVVVFVGTEPSEAVREYAVKRLAPLSLAPSVRGCRVVLEAHNHAHAGHRYRAKIEVQAARATLVVGSAGEAFADLYAAIDASALDALRVVRERERRDHHQLRTNTR